MHAWCHVAGHSFVASVEEAAHPSSSFCWRHWSVWATSDAIQSVHGHFSCSCAVCLDPQTPILLQRVHGKSIGTGSLQRLGKLYGNKTAPDLLPATTTPGGATGWLRPVNTCTTAWLYRCRCARLRVLLTARHTCCDTCQVNRLGRPVGSTPFSPGLLVCDPAQQCPATSLSCAGLCVHRFDWT